MRTEPLPLASPPTVPATISGAAVASRLPTASATMPCVSGGDGTGTLKYVAQVGLARYWQMPDTHDSVVQLSLSLQPGSSVQVPPASAGCRS